MDERAMTIQLPETFVSRMRQQLGKELPAFLQALNEFPVRGIRFNFLKKTQDLYKEYGNEPIPWMQDAYYLPVQTEAGLCVLHEAGAYYIQEPAAMIPAAVLDAKPGEKILDLCAAPGGKTTQMGCAMRGEGLIVCNEPVPKRAQILSRNIERMGLPNCIVTCARPEQLAYQWPEGFDAVLVDAPCSGEGMFRRDPNTRMEWSAAKAEGCSERQREILSAAAGLVRPGGRLVYSTCTYNPQENENNARWFTERFREFSIEPFTLPGIEGEQYMFTCYPHRIKGEGQFAVSFRKSGNKAGHLPQDHSVRTASDQEKELFADAFPSLPEATHRIGNTLIFIPELPDLKGIRTYRIGLHLGDIRGRIAIPDHAAALCIGTTGVPSIELSPEQAVMYMGGETIPEDARGWIRLCYRGIAIGWGKGSDGMIKNHYPKALRSSRFLP